MNVRVLRPHPVLGPLEAMKLRDGFDLATEDGRAGVIVDLTGVQHLSGAGLAALTNLAARGRRIGVPVRVLLPAEGTAAARLIDQADLRRFLRPGGIWNPVRLGDIRSAKAGNRPNGPRAGLMEQLGGPLRRGGDRRLVTA